jgi:hypothetical protein
MYSMESMDDSHICVVPFLIVYAGCCEPGMVPVLQSLWLLLLMCYTTKYINIKSTVYVPSSKLGLSQPLSRQRVCPSPQNRGGHTRLRVRGWGSPNSGDRRKSLALCLLCVLDYLCGSGCDDQR